MGAGDFAPPFLVGAPPLFDGALIGGLWVFGLGDVEQEVDGLGAGAGEGGGGEGFAEGVAHGDAVLFDLGDQRGRRQQGKQQKKRAGHCRVLNRTEQQNVTSGLRAQQAEPGVTRLLGYTRGRSLMRGCVDFQRMAREWMTRRPRCCSKASKSRSRWSRVCWCRRQKVAMRQSMVLRTVMP